MPPFERIMKRYRTPIISSALLFLSPLLASAQLTNFMDVSEFVLKVIRGAANILFALAALGLIYGVIVYFANSGNPQKREEIKPYLFWAVIGVTVMLGIWGFVGILYASLFGGGSFGIPFLHTPT